MGKEAGVSDEAVTRATGRDWSAWFAALDRAGAEKLPHKEIAQLLNRKLGVESGWWSQTITVGYERARGLRDMYQKADGYAAGVSRTFAVSADFVFAAWVDTRKRRAWLAEPCTITTSTPGKSMRIAWPDGTRVDVYFTEKSAGKTQLAVQHTKLPDPDAVAMRKAFWKDALERLGERLTR
jgi:hypothetical protein